MGGFDQGYIILRDITNATRCKPATRCSTDQQQSCYKQSTQSTKPIHCVGDQGLFGDRHGPMEAGNTGGGRPPTKREVNQVATSGCRDIQLTACRLQRVELLVPAYHFRAGYRVQTIMSTRDLEHITESTINAWCGAVLKASCSTEAMPSCHLCTESTGDWGARRTSSSK